jgi:imidazolonepropionase-like amidohydrolase
MKALRSTRLALAAAALLGPAAASRAQDIAVRGDLVQTMAGEPLHDAIVLVRDGRIADVGPAAVVVVPPGMPEVRAAVVTPGLIDAHSCVGLAGWLNQPTDQDEVDKGAPIQPELRAVDAYNARERLIEWIRGLGVTTIHTGHAPGALVAGQTLIAKTVGTTVDQAVIVPEAMIAVTLGDGGRETDEKKSPGTRAKQVAMLREELIKAQEYVRKQGAGDEEKRPERDLRLEALVDVLERRIPLLVTAHRHTDIESALRLQKEFNLRIVLDGGAESYLLVDELAAAQVPVIVHPTMTRAEGETENLSMETAGKLHAAGIPIALQSGYEGYVPRTRVVLYEAAVAAANGLPADAALAAITIGAARLLGIDERVGSIEIGKDGDLALYDGDPFEYTSHCVGVVVNGRVASDQVR